MNRKEQPVTTGLLDYFPDAMLAIANVSKIGNDQHNPGEPLHWAREKSSDHADCLARHLIDRGKLDTDGLMHSAKVAWRALALLQLEIEQRRRVETALRPVTQAEPVPVPSPLCQCETCVLARELCGEMGRK